MGMPADAGDLSSIRSTSTDAHDPGPFGETTNADSGFDQTTVMFEPAAEADANELAAGVADQLGEPEVLPMIGGIRDRSGEAPLALVIGRDDSDFGS